MTFRSILSFVVGIVRDPVTKDLSSTRVLAILCAFVAFWVVHRYPPTTAVAAVTTALIGGGAVALVTRKQSPGGDA